MLSEVIGELVTMFTSDLTGLTEGITKSKSLIQDTTKQIGDMGKALTVGVTLPIVGFGIAAVKAAADSQLIVTKLDLAIKNAGSAANTTSKQAQELAKSLELMSGVDNEVIMGAETTTAGFKTISKEIFPQVTAAALDMSAALGTDVVSATRSLDLALVSPETGLRRLRMQGIIFTEAQKKMITEMVKSGNLMGAQKIILDTVESKYKGAAKAIGDTAVGAMHKFENAIGDLTKAIGDQLLPIFTPIVNKITDFIVGLQKADPAIIRIGIGIAAAAALAGPLLAVIAGLGSAITLILSPIGALIAAVALLSAAWATDFGGIRETVIPIIGRIVETFQTLKAQLTGTVVPVIERVAYAFKLFKSQLGDFVSNVKKFGIAKALDSALNLGAWNIWAKKGPEFVKGWIQGILEALGIGEREAQYAVLGINSTLQSIIGTFTDFVTFLKPVTNLVKNFFNTLFGPGTLEFGTRLKWAVDQAIVLLPGVIGKLLSSIGSFISSNANKLLSSFGDLFMNVAAWINGGGLDRLSKAFSDLMGGIGSWVSNSAWPWLQTGFKKLFESGGNWVSSSDGVKHFTDGFSALMTSVSNWITNSAWPPIKKGIETLFASVSDWITKTAWPTIKTGIEAMFTSAKDWVSNEAWPAIKTGFESLFDSVKNWFEGGGLDTFTSGLVSLITKAGDWIANDAVPFIVGGFTTLMDAVVKWLTTDGEDKLENDGIGKAVKDAIKWIDQKGIPLAESAFLRLVTAIVKVLGKITQAIIDSVTDGINKAIAHATGINTKEIGQNVNPVVKSVIQNMPFGFGSVASGLFGWRDSGGPGQAGQPVMIGKGAQPELFVPSTSGNFYPAGSYGGSGGGGAQFIDVTLRADSLVEHILIKVANNMERGRQAG